MIITLLERRIQGNDILSVLEIESTRLGHCRPSRATMTQATAYH